MQGIKHTPTDENRALIRDLVLADEPRERIAKRLKMDYRVLIENYEDDLEMAKTDLLIETNKQTIANMRKGKNRDIITCYEYILGKSKASVTKENSDDKNLISEAEETREKLKNA